MFCVWLEYVGTCTGHDRRFSNSVASKGLPDFEKPQRGRQEILPLPLFDASAVTTRINSLPIGKAQELAGNTTINLESLSNLRLIFERARCGGPLSNQSVAACCRVPFESIEPRQAGRTIA
jgi:hypothetical protein